MPKLHFGANESWSRERVEAIFGRLAEVSGVSGSDQDELRFVMDKLAELGNSGPEELVSYLADLLATKSGVAPIYKLAIVRLDAAQALRKNQLELAIRHALIGREIALASGWESEVGVECTMLGIVHLRRAEYSKARAYFEESIVAARRSGLRDEEARGLVNLSLVLKNSGALRESETALRLAREIAVQCDNRVRIAQCDQNLSSVLFRRSLWTSAAEHAERAMLAFDDLGLPNMANSAILALARAKRALGDLPGAREQLQQAYQAARIAELPRNQVVALEFLGDCDLDDGRPDDALGKYTEALVLARDLGARTDLVVECTRGIAMSELALQNVANALHYAGESVELAEEQGDSYELANSLLVRARIRLAMGESAVGLADLAAARGIANDIGDRFVEAHAILLRAEVGLGGPESERSRAGFVLAAHSFESLGAERWRIRAEALADRALSQHAFENGGHDAGVIEAIDSACAGFLTVDPRVRRTLSTIATLAPQTLNILVLGESGTGKELIAQAVHDQSGRKGPFVPVNCSAFPGDLIEGELFGHARGAYTGADRERVGLFEYAHKGTLFLDEIGDMPVKAQARLLRALENGEVRRLGENNSRTVDVRVVAATHRHLLEMVGAGEFRLDLYYRLAGYVVDLPPVRERKEDAKLLIDHFLARYAKEQGKTLALTAELRHELSIHSWPGNVREIKMVMQRLASLTPSGTTIRKLPFNLEGDPRPRSLPEVLEAEEKKRILDALQAHNWNKARAAMTLGTNRTTLIGKMKRMGIELSKQR